MANQKPLLSKFLSILLLSLSLSLWGHPPLVMTKEVIPIGVVLDLKSPVGSVAESYLSMGLSDFYAVNDNYSTRLSLLIKDSGNDIIAAASATLDLIKNEEVQASIGLKGQHKQDESAQVKAIVDIVKAFGWGEIVPIYEDTEYGNGLIPYLMDALQEIDTRVPYRSVIPASSNNTEISEELNKLKANRTRVFLVHMTASLGSKLFVLPKNVEMMSEGHAWIITQGFSSLLDPMGSKVMDSMQVWALVMAVEKAGIVHSSFSKQNASNSNVDLGSFRHFGNRGFSLDLTDTSEEAYSTSKDKLKQPIWPGYTTDQPKKLRIGVPIRNGFEEFLKVEWHSSTDDKPSIPGFVIDVFHALQDALPFPLSHEFIPYVNKHRQSNGTYDELLDQKDLSSRHFKREESRVLDMGSPDVFQLSPSIDDMQNHSRNSTEGTNDVIIHDDNRSLSSSSRHSDASMQDVPSSS
nr:glutamate receptor 2.2 [Quercus suber]